MGNISKRTKICSLGTSAAANTWKKYCLMHWQLTPNANLKALW